MSIDIIEVKTRKNLRKFIHLPAKIHKGHKNWVPPVYMDEWVYFNPKKNQAFDYSDTLLLLAIKNNKPVGRIMGIINHRYNDAKNEKDGRFIFLDTFHDDKIAEALLKAVESWARSKGMERMVGPLGFSDKDPQGLMIEGYDKPVVIASNCNFPYLVEFVEKSGYSKKVDLVVYKTDIPNEIPEFYRRIYERAIRNNKTIRIVELSSRRQIKPYIRPVMTLVNETYKDIYAFAPLGLKEMDDFARRYMAVLDKRFIKIIENEHREVVAFVLGIPDISRGIVKSRGYVLPFGIFHILRSQRKTKQLDLLLGAIREDCRNTGLDTILGVKMLQEIQKTSIEYIDSHLILETNLKMRAEMERMGGVVYKKYRIFQKDL
nr:hypothetical protein [Bacteroidota bacterium]